MHVIATKVNSKYGNLLKKTNQTGKKHENVCRVDDDINKPFVGAR